MDLDAWIERDESESRLHAVGRWRRTRNRLDKEIRAETVTALREARAIGTPASVIAQEWAMTEGRVYQLLRDHGID